MAKTINGESLRDIIERLSNKYDRIGYKLDDAETKEEKVKLREELEEAEYELNHYRRQMEYGVFDADIIPYDKEESRRKREQTKELLDKMAKGGSVRDYNGLSKEDKFIADQMYYVISLNSVSEKKKVIKESLLANMEDYNISDVTKKITKANLTYAMNQKTTGAINKALETSIDALRVKMAKGGNIDGYKGKTAEDVWNNWSTEQRRHFLKDHNILANKADDHRASMYRLDELPIDLINVIKSSLTKHMSEGQYAKGGSINPEIETKKASLAKIMKVRDGANSSEMAKAQAIKVIEKLEKEIAELEKAPAPEKKTRASRKPKEVAPETKPKRNLAPKTADNCLMTLAKEIRKDGETYTQAMKRAGVIMKEAKSKGTKPTEIARKPKPTKKNITSKKRVAAKTVAPKSKKKKITSKKRELKAVANRTELGVKMDAKRQALPSGKRISADGNVYYESRENRADKFQPKKKNITSKKRRL